MKLFISLVALIFFASTESVMGALKVRIVFNRGVTESHKWCSSTDWNKVAVALDQAAARRLGSTQGVSRQLQNCAGLCGSFAQRTCHLTGTGCRGGKREVLELESVGDEAPPLSLEDQANDVEHGDRQLYLDHECAEKKNRMVNGLNSIQNQVSSNCRNLITSQHDLTCYDL